MVINQKIHEKYAIYNGDNMEVIKGFDNNSIHASIYSPPFAGFGGGLYHYSSDDRDMSNCFGYSEFFDHYDFLIKEIERVTMSGRCTAVHCTDTSNGNSGKDSQTDFPGDIIKHHVMCRNDNCNAPLFDRLNGKCGHGLFYYIGRHQIWKEPLWVRNRTMTKNLSHKTTVDDSVFGGIANADYLLIFRKKGENKIPVVHPTGFHYYAGGCPMPDDINKLKGFKGDQKQNRYSHWIWRRYASSIWDDIRGFLGEYNDKKFQSILQFIESKDGSDQEEKHVHPLPLDVYFTLY